MNRARRRLTSVIVQISMSERRIPFKVASGKYKQLKIRIELV